eukprot:jgi/Undpi1/552/HiC_scaffold_10.g04016.m1
MYLRFRDGIIYGLGYETIRKLCKVSGKYKLNPRSNQTTLAFTCTFSNELDTVMFHGCGNGTGFIGNCYIHEINRFSTFSDVPGIRSMGGDKSKGSFLFLKMDSMGDPALRLRLHSRRVHKWAGKLFPDDTAVRQSLPSSNVDTPPPTPAAPHGEGFCLLAISTQLPQRAPRSYTPPPPPPPLLSPCLRTRVYSYTPVSNMSGSTRSSLPPWVQPGAFDPEADEVDDYTVTSSTVGRSLRSPAGGDSSRRGSMVSSRRPAAGLRNALPPRANSLKR